MNFNKQIVEIVIKGAPSLTLKNSCFNKNEILDFNI